MNACVREPDRGPKPGRICSSGHPDRVVAALDFAADGAARQRPEDCRGMAVRMVLEGVALQDHAAAERAILIDAPPDHKKRGARLVGSQEIEQARRLHGVRPVVDREPDLVGPGLEMARNRPVEGGVSEQGRPEAEDLMRGPSCGARAASQQDAGRQRRPTEEHDVFARAHRHRKEIRRGM